MHSRFVLPQGNTGSEEEKNQAKFIKMELGDFLLCVVSGHVVSF